MPASLFAGACCVTKVAVFWRMISDLEDMMITGKYKASGLLLKQGIRIDLSTHRFKKIKKAFSFIDVSDKWLPLPKLEYVLVFKTFYAKCEPCDMSETAPGTFQVSLVYGKHRRLIVHEGNTLEEAMKIAEELAGAFQLRIRDAATNRRAPVWLAA